MILYQEDLRKRVYKAIKELEENSSIVHSIILGSKGQGISVLDIDCFVSYFRAMVDTLCLMKIYNSSFKDDERLIEKENRLSDLVNHTQNSITSLIVKSNSCQ